MHHKINIYLECDANRITFRAMANVLPTEKKTTAVSMLCEGNSIRSVERMTGIHRDTVMRLGARIGEACRDLLDETMRELPCKKIEVDEIWGFVGKKQRNVKVDDDEALGDVWTWVAIVRNPRPFQCFTLESAHLAMPAPSWHKSNPVCPTGFNCRQTAITPIPAPLRQPSAVKSITAQS